MTEQQRRQRAAFICEQPGLWLFLLYAACFVGCAVASDVLQWASGEVVSCGQRYLLPAVIALPMWRMLRRWALQGERASLIPPQAVERWADRVLPPEQYKAASFLTADPAEPGAAADRPRDTCLSAAPRFLPREPAAELGVRQQEAQHGWAGCCCESSG